VEVIYFMVLIS